jgi:5-methylcytosine-specific restriction endonuclease McrA
MQETLKNTYPPTVQTGFRELDVVKTTANGWRFSLTFKRALWEVSGKRCCYCGDEINTHKTMHVDHFIPRRAGGTHALANLVSACSRCNMLKGDREPEYLRYALAMVESHIAGIITTSQAIELNKAGVNLPIVLGAFHYEKRYL